VFDTCEHLWLAERVRRFGHVRYVGACETRVGCAACGVCVLVWGRFKIRLSGVTCMFCLPTLYWTDSGLQFIRVLPPAPSL